VAVLRIKDPPNFRRTLVGLCLIVAPLIILAGSVIQPTSEGDEVREWLPELAEDPGRNDAATTLFIFGFVLLVPAIIGLVHLIRDRGIVLGHIGGVLAVLGSILYPVLFSTTFYDLSLAENLPIDQAVKAQEGTEDYVGVYFIFIPAIFGWTLGLILLSIALVRARVAPVWFLVLVVLANVAIFAGNQESVIVAALGSLLFLVAFGSLGLKVLGMSDADWEDPRRLAAARPAAAPASEPPGGGPPAGGPPPGGPPAAA
jgi:hypothetical protein